jgi:hypothetical protein
MVEMVESGRWRLRVLMLRRPPGQTQTGPAVTDERRRLILAHRGLDVKRKQISDGRFGKRRGYVSGEAV